MESRNLGRSGLRVSTVGLGCNNFGGRITDLEQTRAVVHAACDAGITLFDTADRYGNFGGSETQMGQTLGERRKDIVLATKFGGAMADKTPRKGASRGWIMQAVEDSLRRLQTDWIDLYQLHFPDDNTPIDETLRALEDVVKSGKVRYIGCSNLRPWEMVEASFHAELAKVGAFISAQEEYSLLIRDIESDLLPVARRYGYGLLPYYPLANGLLTGKYKREVMPEGARLTLDPTKSDNKYINDQNWDRVEQLTAFCEERGHTILELAFCWLLAEPLTASVIAGATKPEQVHANVAAASWVLSADEMAAVAVIIA
jgi:aryl-alcohol dehydrogenase-like predicted oxidoreductase